MQQMIVDSCCDLVPLPGVNASASRLLRDETLIGSDICQAASGASGASGLRLDKKQPREVEMSRPGDACARNSVRRSRPAGVGTLFRLDVFLFLAFIISSSGQNPKRQDGCVSQLKGANFKLPS